MLVCVVSEDIGISGQILKWNFTPSGSASSIIFEDNAGVVTTDDTVYSGVVVNNTHTLTVENVKLSDEGIYSCDVTNTTSNESDSENVEVKVEGKTL